MKLTFRIEPESLQVGERAKIEVYQREMSTKAFRDALKKQSPLVFIDYELDRFLPALVGLCRLTHQARVDSVSLGLEWGKIFVLFESE